MTVDAPATHRLTPLLVLTDRHQSEAAGRRLIDTVAAAVKGGAPTVLLREKDLSRAQRYLLALSLTDLLVPRGAALAVASDVKMALEVGAVAVHLAAADPVPDTTGWPPAMVWGRSCHSVDDVARAAADGAGYVTLSPIFPTASKPGYGPPLGTTALTRTASASAATAPPPAKVAAGNGPARPGTSDQPSSPVPTTVDPWGSNVDPSAGHPPDTRDTASSRSPEAGGPAPAEGSGPIVFALGGVRPANVQECVQAGAGGVAAMGGVMGASNPAAAVAAYLADLPTLLPPTRFLGRR